MEVQSWIETPGSELQSTSTISEETCTSFTSIHSNASPQTIPSLQTLQQFLPPLCITSLKAGTSQISCLAVHHNTLYAASINRIKVYDLTNHELIDTFSCSDSASGLIKSIAFGKGKIFTAHQDSKIRVWQLTPSGRHLLLSTLPTVKDRLRRCIWVKNYVHVRRHKKRLWIDHADAVSGLIVKDGLLYSVSWDKSFKIWRMSDLRCLESVDAHQDAVNAVAVSVDGTVYTASADGRIRVWQRGDERDRRHGLTTTLEGHGSTVNALALNGNGSVLFSGGCDRLILVWEREDSANHITAAWSLGGHAGAVLCLIYVDDLLVSGSSDRTVRIWRHSSVSGGYCCLTVLEGHEKPVKSLGAACGKTSNDVVSIYSGSLDGEIKVWKLTVSNPNNIESSVIH